MPNFCVPTTSSPFQYFDADPHRLKILFDSLVWKQYFSRIHFIPPLKFCEHDILHVTIMPIPVLPDYFPIPYYVFYPVKEVFYSNSYFFHDKVSLYLNRFITNILNLRIREKIFYSFFHFFFGNTRKLTSTGISKESKYFLSMLLLTGSLISTDTSYVVFVLGI